MTIAFLAFLLLTPARAASAAQPPAPASAQAPAASNPAAVKPAEVKASTGSAPAAQADPSTVYTGEKMRDPFRAASSGSSGVATHPFGADDFNIHNLSLRGLMKDRSADFALFADPAFGVTFVLRGNRLYDSKGKVVPGVTGSLNIKQKTAHLMNQESDVQTFRLGEESAQ